MRQPLSQTQAHALCARGPAVPMINPNLRMLCKAFFSTVRTLRATSNVTAATEVRSVSFGLVLHAQHICANSVNFSRHLRVTGYNSRFPVHILCIRYGTVLANIAVICMRVRIVCLPVRGAPW